MWKNFEKLAQANVDHFNNNPKAHAATTAAYGVVAVVAIGVMAKRLAGKYAKN